MEILQCKINEKGRIFKKGMYSELVFYIRGQVGVGQVVVGHVAVGQLSVTRLTQLVELDVMIYRLRGWGH
jgi:hypothetical protein